MLDKNFLRTTKISKSIWLFVFRMAFNINNNVAVYGLEKTENQTPATNNNN